MVTPTRGGYWEQHCHERVTEAGFEKMGDEWPGCYWHNELELYLVVYVDDMKLSGPKKNVKEGWKRLTKDLKFDQPETAGRFLGCEHKIKEVVVKCRKYQVMEYNMEEFFGICVER